MTERDEQGFVKDIKAAIDAISNENKTSKEKVRELIELPFSVEDVIDVVNFVNQETSEEVDVRDELYNLAILNEQLNGFDEMFKSKLEERHNDLVEALMNRMEGVFKMYDVNENENVLGVDPTLEQPVEVQTPQLDELSPENLAEPMEVVAGEPIATVDAPEMVAPTVDPTLFAEPTAYGEVPEMVMPTIEPVMPEASVEAPTVPSFEEFINANEFEAPVEEEPVAEVAPTAPSFEEFINNNEFEMPAEEPVMEAPVEEPAVEENAVPSFADFINNMPETTYEEPAMEIPPMEVPVEEPVAEETPAQEAYEEPAIVMPTFEAPVEEEPVAEEAPVEENTDEDEAVLDIINKYDTLKELNIKVYNDQKQLKELENRVEELKTEISNNQDKIKNLAA